MFIELWKDFRLDIFWLEKNKRFHMYRMFLISFLPILKIILSKFGKNTILWCSFPWFYILILSNFKMVPFFQKSFICFEKLRPFCIWLIVWYYILPLQNLWNFTIMYNNLVFLFHQFLGKLKLNCTVNCKGQIQVLRK